MNRPGDKEFFGERHLDVAAKMRRAMNRYIPRPSYAKGGRVGGSRKDETIPALLDNGYIINRHQEKAMNRIDSSYVELAKLQARRHQIDQEIWHADLEDDLKLYELGQELYITVARIASLMEKIARISRPD